MFIKRNLSPPITKGTKFVGFLEALALPNSECGRFNRFDAADLSVAEWTGQSDYLLSVSLDRVASYPLW